MGRAFAAVGVAGPLETAALRCFLTLLGLVVTGPEVGGRLLGECGAVKLMPTCEYTISRREKLEKVLPKLLHFGRERSQKHRFLYIESVGLNTGFVPTSALQRRFVINREEAHLYIRSVLRKQPL
jgi:hypothetical protein